MTLTIACCISVLIAILPVRARAEGPTREPIKVHGHWTIEVYNRDGTFASRHEFENALGSAGGELISRVLSGQPSYGFRVGVTAVPPAMPPCQTINGPDYCLLVQPGDGLVVVPNTFKNLQVMSTPAGTLLMIGRFDIANTTTIGLVVSLANFPAFSPSIFTPASTDGFTRALLAIPVPVEAGQTVRLRIEISFA